MTNEELLLSIRGMIQEELKPIKEEITTVKKEVTTIKEEITTVKKEVSTIKEEVSTINGKLDNLESKIDQLAADSQKDIMSMLELQNKKIDDIRDDIHSVIEVTGEHEIRIRTLSRRAI